MPHRLIPISHHYVLLALDATCATVAGIGGQLFAQAMTSTEARGGLAFVAVSLGTILLGRLFDEVGKRRQRREVVEDREHEERLLRQDAELQELRKRVRAVTAKAASNEGKADASLRLLSGSGIRPAVDPAAAPPGTRFPVVLVVEDDPSSAKILSKMLPEEGFEVIHSPTVADAMLYIDVPPAAVLLDLNLPDGNGLAILRAIDDHGLPSRVAIMTGSADEATMAEVARLKPERVYIRPINYKALVEWLKSPAPPDGGDVLP
jgi:CheY-like chemotaxis protein